jgi:hypothetical protein
MTLLNSGTLLTTIGIATRAAHSLELRVEEFQSIFSF